MSELFDAIETKIGYDRIRGQVSALCTTAGGREKFSGEIFSTDGTVVSLRLRLCDQMRYILTMESGFPSGEYTDIDALIPKIGIEGAFLDADEILLLRSALALATDILAFFRVRDGKQYADLGELCRGINAYPEIVSRINAILDRFGNVRDDASDKLRSLRRAMKEREGQISGKLQQILSHARSSGIVEAGASVSIREGRSVIPVPAVNKKRLKGIIHDESATGKTVFIEPAEIVEINNELRELEYEEKREIVRIFTEFTDLIRPEAEGLSRTGDFITTMDMIRAKARFAVGNGCTMPILSDDGTLELRSARHPLLEQTLRKEGRAVVPLDMELTREKHILVISGPNAGGKSVCLKTVGLLQWMFQCGMPVPLLENSQMPLFDRIFIDIGDEQSIENDLSTYSSHLLNMKVMLQRATGRSLILIDEFGSGTEPVIGGAIAEAILEKFEDRGCYGVITTHYTNIKYYAGKATGVVNGAMTFDVQNIQPLFKLEMGVPGSSFAVEVARKIGLPEDIIKSASQKAGTDYMNIESQLKAVARDRRYWEQKRDRIRIADRKIEELERQYGEQLSAIRQQRSAILKQAKEEAAGIVAEANRRIENAIRDIRESQAEKEKSRRARESVESFREFLSGTGDMEVTSRVDLEMGKIAERQRRREEKKTKRGEQDGTAAKTQKVTPPAVPAAGSKVKIEGQDTIGEIQSIRGKKATVMFGQMLTTVELSRLKVVSESEYKKQSRQSKVSTINVSSEISQRKLSFKHTLNVRGMRAAEALEAVSDFIDDAIMVGASEVSILHGKGTGALKEEIRRYLRTVDLVSSAEDEHPDRGGAGITVVRLDV